MKVIANFNLKFSSDWKYIEEMLKFNGNFQEYFIFARKMCEMKKKKLKDHFK